MDLMERWLTRETAERDSQTLIDQVSERLRARESNPYAQVTGMWREAAYNLRREWFRVSIGLADSHERQKETVFLSEAKGVANIPVGPIVPFTHWLGSLYARLREEALKGTYPQQLAYGPPGGHFVLPVGPLVEYRAESVVGLEFDGVFIAGAQNFLLAKASEVQRQRFWVMATRARQHLCVTSCGPVPRLTRWLSEK